MVKFSVAGAGGGGVRQAVLVAKKRGDALKNSRDFTVELREPGIAAGHVCEGFELVLTLQVIQMRTQGAMGIEEVCVRFVQAHAKNGGVSLAEQLHGLIQGVL